jgi:hypothetical protein
MIKGLYGWLVDTLGLDESNLRSPLEWASGLWALLKRSTPGTRERRVWLALRRGRILYAAPNGHVQVCRFGLEWQDESKQLVGAFFLAADNTDQLEPAARGYLASINQQLDDGQFIPCPARLARLAVWGELAEA